MTSIDLQIPNGDQIIIEERPDREMTHVGEHRIAAAGKSTLKCCYFVFSRKSPFFTRTGIACWNPSFDVTPASLIRGIITEKGVFEPPQLSERVKEILSLK